MKRTLGITDIASFIPSGRISNYERKDQFEMDDVFIEQKIGVAECARKDPTDRASDLCAKAFESLLARHPGLAEQVDCCVVVTQNPDHNLPHTAAIVHGRLNLPETCAAFDISLGCSGFVYGLSVVEAFMQANGMVRGLLFTADPYSEIIDPDDRNTVLLFGDAATVTLIGEQPLFTSGRFTFGTMGKNYADLINRESLEMNGRAIFNFAAKAVPEDLRRMLALNGIDEGAVDRFILHQGSRYIVETIRKRMNLSSERVPYDILHYGNTVSSSIPLILEKEIRNQKNITLAMCGFGVGLSWSSGVLRRAS